MSLDIISTKNIVGNETIINNINNIIINNKLTNSYIIEGLKGSGKTLLGKYFAKALLCQDFDGDTCNQCVNCINFEKNNLTDVFYISAKKSALSIEEVRKEILDNVYIKPTSLDYKIFIINADEITIQAQNSLLKTIEEPPSYAVFIFTTSKINTFLPTILSRCTLFKTQYIGSNLILEHLKTTTDIETHKLEVATNFETGSIGQAIDIATSTNFEVLRSNTLQYIKDVNSADVLGCINIAKACEPNKSNMDMFFNILLLLYRDLFVYKTTKNESLIFQKDIKNEIIEISEDIEVKKLSENFAYINEAINSYKLSNSFLLNLETLFLKLSCNL